MDRMPPLRRRAQPCPKLWARRPTEAKTAAYRQAKDDARKSTYSRAAAGQADNIAAGDDDSEGGKDEQREYQAKYDPTDR